VSEQQMHQSVARAAAILDAIGTSAGPGMRAAEIAEAAGLGLSTTTRLLATLLELGFASRVSEREYALGPRLLALSSQELNQSAVFRESRMLCQSLAQSTRLTANVAVRHGARCVYLCHFEGDLSPKNQSMVGLAMPLHAELSRQLEEGRERGYCVEDQELALGRFCLASPVRDRTGGICAAVSVSGRISVFTGDQRSSIQEQLVESADRISVNLGHLSGASAG
jgi:DNA-binding IclR family transcriptional regulator